jgi:hypothetical protein
MSIGVVAAVALPACVAGIWGAGRGLGERSGFRYGSVIDWVLRLLVGAGVTVIALRVAMTIDAVNLRGLEQGRGDILADGLASALYQGGTLIGLALVVDQLAHWVRWLDRRRDS